MTQEELNQINEIYLGGRYFHRCIEQVDEYKRLEYLKIFHEERQKSKNDMKREEIFNSSAISDKTKKINDVGDALMSLAPKELAEGIKDAKGWAGYAKLRQIAKLK